VRATLAFGDSPLVGELRILPSAGATDWHYSVDLNRDGRVDEAGFLLLGVSIAYEFRKPGLHPIIVELERGDERHRFERVVVVNDPTAVRTLAQASLAQGYTSFGGIAVDRSGRNIFIAGGDNGSLFVLNPVDLTTRWSLPLPYDENHGPEGVALEAERVLVDVGDSIVAVQLTDRAIQESIVDAHWGPFLIRRPDGRVYVAGFAGVGLVDPAAGKTLRARDVEFDGGPVALSPDGRALAFVQGYAPAVLFILDPDQLSAGRMIVFEQNLSAPAAISFDEDGHHVYALFAGADWRLLVLEVSTGKILKDLVVARGGSPSFGVNPVTLSSDGRFVVFSTPRGALFVDTRLDLPRFRTVKGNLERAVGCCNVAASPTSNDFFFTDPEAGSVSKVRLFR
jgi:hypothetical protein